MLPHTPDLPVQTITTIPFSIKLSADRVQLLRNILNDKEFNNENFNPLSFITAAVEESVEQLDKVYKVYLQSKPPA